MSSYSNGSGLKIIRHPNQQFILELSEHLEIYIPFISLQHLQIHPASATEFRGHFTAAFTYSQLIRLSQILAHLIQSAIPKYCSLNKCHQLHPLELLAIATTLPIAVSQDLEISLYSINSRSTPAWDYILTGSMAARRFADALVQYLTYRSGFQEHDTIRCWDDRPDFQWSQGQFTVVRI
jgi:hypothetical protein